MLQRLFIQNLATIDTIDVHFESGLSALTGETGAGKSILIGGLELALGERASQEAIRPGQNVAVVEALFTGPFPAGLTELVTGEVGIEWPAPDPLLLRREVTRSGRNRCFINEQMVGVGDLKTVGQWLVDLHGQHEHQSLLGAAAGRQALDAFAGHEALVEDYRRAWQEVRELIRRSEELESAAQNFEQRRDYLQFQLAEFEKLSPQAGEIEQLTHEEKHLAHAEDLARNAAQAYGLLYEGAGEDAPSLLGLLREVEKRLEPIAQMEEEFGPWRQQLGDCKISLEELAYVLRDYAESTQDDPQRLEEVGNRLHRLRRLMQRHGGDEAAMLAAWDALNQELESMQQGGEQLRNIQDRLEKARKNLGQAAQCLSQSRQQAAATLAKAVSKLLGELCLEKARFEVQLEPMEEPGSEGAERVELMFSANPGLPLAPLRKVGSGGELSRIMLAIKSVLAARDPVPTLVFDEIDAGISGQAARRVGALLEKLGATHQVLCITHHAPIAARARWHASVSKVSRRGATFSSIATLCEEDRLAELARMMGSDSADGAAREVARQMME